MSSPATLRDQIHDNTVEIYLLFERYQSNAAQPNQKLAALLKDRWNVWDTYAGAGATTKESYRLDRRLEGLEEVSTAFMQLLSVIHGNLCKVLVQPSLDDIIPDDRLEKFMDPDVSLNDLATADIHELIGTFPWGEITVALSDLLSLTRTVRRAAAKSSSSSSRHVRDDDEYFRRLCRVLARYHLQHARSTMTDLIGDSIYERRKRLLYRMGHEERIRPQSQSTTYMSDPSSKTPAMKFRQVLDTSEPRRPDIVRPPQSTQISKPMRSILRAPRQTRTVITRPGGFIPGDQNRMPYPDRPVDSVCDYCLEPLKVPLSDHEWHTHIENDLQVFLCLAEQCSSSIPFFARKDFWLKHMEAHFADWPQKVQLTTWFCDIAHEQINFNNVLDFRLHLDSVHRELPEHRKDAYARRKRAVGIRASGICPVCERAVSSIPEQPCGYEEMVQHIVQHLRTMAMLSLPTTSREIEASLLLLGPQNGTSASPSDGSYQSQQPLSIDDSDWTERTTEGDFTLADASLATTGEGLESDMEADQATQDQLRDVVVQKVESQHRKDDVLLDYAAKQVAAASNRTETSEAEAESQDTGAARANTPLSPPPRPVQNSDNIRDFIWPELNSFEGSFSDRAHTPGTTQLPDTTAKRYRCDILNCGRREGFATLNDLERHRKSAHRARPAVGSTYGFICQACVQQGGKEKFWPRRDNFKAHIDRKHAEWDKANLLEISRSHRPDDATTADARFNPPSKPEDNRTASWLIWLRLNKDETDLISAAELSQAISLGGHTTFSEQTTKMLIRMFDAERSGTINFEDFCGIWQYITAWSKLFGCVQGPSGKVSPGQFEDALVAFGYRLSPDFTRLVFDTCTEIGNGLDGRPPVSYAVLAQGFAPGTTAGDIEEWLTASSIDFLEPALIREGKVSVSVEMTFTSERDAKKAVDSFHGLQWVGLEWDHARKIFACQVISFEGFVYACARLKQMTDVFKKHDDDRDGYITLGFEDFLTDAFGLLLHEYIEED